MTSVRRTNFGEIENVLIKHRVKLALCPRETERGRGAGMLDVDMVSRIGMSSLSL